MNQWGPAGGKTVRVAIPAGVAMVDIDNSGSQTGIELSDLRFHPDYCARSKPHFTKQRHFAR